MACISSTKFSVRLDNLDRRLDKIEQSLERMEKLLEEGPSYRPTDKNRSTLRVGDRIRFHRHLFKIVGAGIHLITLEAEDSGNEVIRIDVDPRDVELIQRASEL